METVRPEGFEPLPQNTGLTQKCEQGGTESGTIPSNHDIDQVAQMLSELSPDVLRKVISLLSQLSERNLMG